MQIKQQKHSAPYSKNWTSQEQILIKSLIEDSGLSNWAKIATLVSQQTGEELRTGKQCRQRYINYIKFDSNKDELLKWTAEEEEKLFSEYMRYGSRWVLISKSFKNKSENCLKNKFYGSLRKLVRKLNLIGKEKRKVKKQIKFQSIMRPLEFSEQSYAGSLSLPDLKTDILNAAQLIEIQEERALQIIRSINKFNLQTRSFCGRKKHALVKGRQTKQTNFELSIHLNEKELPSESLNQYLQAPVKLLNRVDSSIQVLEDLNAQPKLMNFEQIEFEDSRNRIHSQLWIQQDISHSLLRVFF